MKVKTRKTLVLTKTEQKAFTDFYDIMNSDKELSIYGVWEILQNIASDKDALEYGYDINIVD